MSEIIASGLKKSYKTGNTVLAVLKGIDFRLPENSFITLMGPSGSGKSSLMHILSGIDRADEGSLSILGTEISQMSEKEISIYRRNHIAIIFQFFNLLPYLNAIENVSLPLYLNGMGKKQAHELAAQALEMVDLKERFLHKPSELSGGEQQRVAIARAIAPKPKLILADEPTGNLDSENSEKIMSLLLDLKKREKFTIFMVTHDPQIGNSGEIRLKMKDGKLV
jgi:putative ABC transport system ATP-binding protein/lipoprotein-releasing system ATP-binding protein